MSKLKKLYFAGFQGCGYINHPLVPASAEGKGKVAFFFDVGAVYQDIAKFEQGFTIGMLHQFFEAITCIAPDGLVGVCFDEAGEGSETFRMEHGVSSGEGYIHVGLNDEAEQFFHGHGFTALVVPRLGIVATGTLVFAPRAIERGAETDAIDGSSVLDVEYANIIRGQFCHSILPI